MNHAWLPSMTQRSPTSKGCMTKRKMIASKICLHVLPNTNTTRSSCDERNNIKCVVAIPSTNNHMMITVMNMRALMKRWSLFTAVFVSHSDKANARRSLYTFTCSISIKEKKICFRLLWAINRQSALWRKKPNHLKKIFNGSVVQDLVTTCILKEQFTNRPIHESLCSNLFRFNSSIK